MAEQGSTTAVLERPVGGGVGSQVAVMQLGFDPELAALLPRLRFDLRGDATAVTELVDGRPASDYLGAVSAPEPEVAAAIGAAVGNWHRGAAQYADRFRHAQVGQPLLFGDASRGDAHRLAIGTPIPAAVMGDSLLRAALGALRREWSPTTVVHGECIPANAVVVHEPDGCGSAEVVLVGWERAGAGDPAWDLGCLMADLLISGLHRHDAAGAEASMSAAMAGYRRTFGHIEDVEAFARRIGLSAVARLVGLAFGPDAGAHWDDDYDDDLLALARSVTAWLNTWSERVALWLS